MIGIQVELTNFALQLANSVHFFIFLIHCDVGSTKSLLLHNIYFMLSKTLYWKQTTSLNLWL